MRKVREDPWLELKELLPRRQFPNQPLTKENQPKAMDNVREIPLDLLDANPYQTRRQLDARALEELCESISALGVIEPIVVRPAGKRRFQIIAGERRVKASYMAGRHMIPAVVRQVGDREAMEMTIVENLQREGLNAMEQAEGLQRLAKEFELTQEELAARTGMERSSVSNLLRLVKLPRRVQKLLRDDKISYTQARALLSLPEEQRAKIEEFARKAVSQTGRQTEQEVAKYLKRQHPGESDEERRTRERSVYRAVRRVDSGKREAGELVQAEQELQQALELPVNIVDKGGSGHVVITYEGSEQFEGLFQMLTGMEV